MNNALQTKLDSLGVKHPSLKPLLSSVDQGHAVTRDFLVTYFSSVETNKSLVLRELIGEKGALKNSLEYYAERGLEYIVNNPFAPLERMMNGDTPSKELIPKSLSTLTGIKRTAYYSFSFEYANKLSKTYKSNVRIQCLCKEVLENFVLSKDTATKFANGTIKNKRISHYFPATSKSLQILNSMTYMQALIPEFQVNHKAQDKLPSTIHRLMCLKSRSIPQALAYTDLFCMSYLGLYESDSSISELSKCLRLQDDIQLDLSDRINSTINGLVGLYIIDPRHEYKKIGGHMGTSFQFNVARIIEKGALLPKELEGDYLKLSKAGMSECIASLVGVDESQLRALLAPHDYDSMSALDVRDYTNIITYSKKLSDQGSLSFDKESPQHYSKVLPSVAKFKMGMRESKRTGLQQDLVKPRRDNPTPASGKRLDQFESLYGIFKDIDTLASDNRFNEFWGGYQARTGLSSDSKQVAYDIWVEITKDTGEKKPQECGFEC